MAALQAAAMSASLTGKPAIPMRMPAASRVSSVSATSAFLGLFRPLLGCLALALWQNSMEKFWLEFWLEKPLEFWLEIPYTKKCSKNG